MKILAVGDIHLGRTPSRLPPDLAGRARYLGPAEAWRRAVNTALESGVRAVLLAGDVVEREEDFFEAYRELSLGVQRLTEAGVEVTGVAGNHDVKVLPRLARQIEHFRLLGAGGNWQSHRITDGSEAVTLWGWSFPQPRVFTSPLPAEPFDRAPGINLGLLHCDRDGGLSPFAPVSGPELDRAGLDGWLLGHIHKPDALTRSSLSGYLGSLAGMDPGEPGTHGPWLITVLGGQIAEVEQLPLAPLRWEPLDIGLDGIGGPEEIQGRVLAEIRKLDGRIASGGAAPDAVGLRVLFRGRTRFGAVARDAIAQEHRGEIYRGSDNRHYFVEAVRVHTRPEMDLRELAERGDPPGLLARRLLWLDEAAGHPERDRLAARAKESLDSELRQSIWSGLRDGDRAAGPDPVQWVREAGFRALERLLAQAPDAG